MKKIGIIGSRRRNNHTDLFAVQDIFDEIFNEGDEIVSGGCPKGGDHFAEIIAKDKGVPIKIYYPDWKRYNRSAGFERNFMIASESTILIACVAEDRTGGTEDTIKKFKKLHPKNEVYLV